VTRTQTLTLTLILQTLRPCVHSFLPNERFQVETEKPKPKSTKKGMSLGVKGKASNALDALAKEEHIDITAAEKKRPKAPAEPGFFLSFKTLEKAL
jgi:hypothetical protein